MKYWLYPIFAVSSLVCPAAQAWNNFGHMEVAAVAWSKMTPEARDRATELLRLNPMFKAFTAGVPENMKGQNAFVMAATWPDKIKFAKGYKNDGAKNGDVPPKTPQASQNIGYTDRFRHKY